jgi:hypothetical protein
MPDHANKDEHLVTAFMRGAPVLIARAMSMNPSFCEIQKHGCIALARLASITIKLNTQTQEQVIVDVGGLKLCHRAAERYKYCPVVSVSVCELIGYLVECQHVREHVAAQGLPIVLAVMDCHKRDAASVLRQGFQTLLHLVKYSAQLLGDVFNNKEAGTTINSNGEAAIILNLISAIEKFPNDAGIQEYGCKFLSSLPVYKTIAILSLKQKVMS